MEDQHYLSRIFSLPKFSEAEQKMIISRFSRAEFKKHQYLLGEGQIARQYWFIQSGFARSFAIDLQGRDISTHFYEAGDIVIDWPSFFLRSPARENIQTLTDCVCWQIDFDNFQSLFHSMEAFREQGRTTLTQSYFALKNHSVSMIADSAKDRYEKLLKQKPRIAQNVPLKQLATYLGITDTSLSRIRKELAHKTNQSL